MVSTNRGLLRVLIVALKPKSIKFQFFGFLFFPFIFGLIHRFLVQLLHVLHNPFRWLQAPQQACLSGKKGNYIIIVTMACTERLLETKQLDELPLPEQG